MLFKNFLSHHTGLADCIIMSLRGRATTEAISYLIDIIEIATPPEGRLVMTHDICDKSLRGSDYYVKIISCQAANMSHNTNSLSLANFVGVVVL